MVEPAAVSDAGPTTAGATHAGVTEAPARRPWTVGAATGVGSLPGTDPDEAMRVVVGELPEFPHLPELPAAGIGTDMVGRGVAHLVDLHAEYTVSGWRFAAHAGADERRARAALARDLDVLEEHTQGFTGPLKIQCVGPITFAAAIELRYGDKALADAGAVRDIAAALAEGVGEVCGDVRRRVPGADVVVQIDEPSLPVALAGRVPTASGFGTLAPVDPGDARGKLAAVVSAIVRAGGTPIIHCCAPAVPFGLFADAGMLAVGVDAGVLTPADDDTIGEIVERGVALFLGLVPALDPPGPPTRVHDLAAPARALWGRLGFAPDGLARDVVVTPACGLAGASPDWPPTAYRTCREVARDLLEAPEDR
jgi:hypothetical protein